MGMLGPVGTVGAVVLMPECACAPVKWKHRKVSYRFVKYSSSNSLRLYICITCVILNAVCSVRCLLLAGFFLGLHFDLGDRNVLQAPWNAETHYFCTSLCN